MPYRRLPNTDIARLKAMHYAQRKGTEIPPFKLAFSQSTLLELQSLLPGYEHSLSEYKNAFSNIIEKNKDYLCFMKKARLYISHFIQVINMAVQRGDLPPSIRDNFGLPDDEKRMFSLSTEDEIIECGKKIIDGDHRRKMEGKTIMTNPSVALVKVHYERFYEVYGYRKSLKNRALRARDDLNTKRDQADKLIQRLWNEVEATYKDLPDHLKRERAAEYGVVYVFRKNEMNHVSSMKTTHA